MNKYRFLQHYMTFLDLLQEELVNANLPGPAYAKPCMQLALTPLPGYPSVYFRPVETLVFVQPRVLILPAATIKTDIMDAMASCAVHRLYIREIERRRVAIDPSQVAKPDLHEYKSPRWMYYFDRLKKYL
jgi:hypothetical protein